MKTSHLLLTLLAGVSFVITPALAQKTAPGINYHIENEHAQTVYEALTGVQEEGAAGHSYRTGKSINCWRINADMDDAKGKPIPQDDARRYKCSMHIDSNGLITPGGNY